MLAFKSLDSYYLKGRGTVYCVENPSECRDFGHLISHQVEIDGEPHWVAGVETFAHFPPYLKGERIGLLVRR